MNRKAVIFGIKGYKLKKKEKLFLKKNKPWGVILFSRNIKDLLQLKNLVSEIKLIFNDNKYPILIDEEGGKVSRIRKIIDLSLFSQKYFDNLFSKNKKKFLLHYKIYINTLCSILNFTGININTVPVLDVKRKKTHRIIDTRSFSNNANRVSLLGSFCEKFFKENKIATVIKHIPGHGLASLDSHFTTPVIKNNISELINKDFKAFKNSSSKFAMTAHIIYKALDSKNTATHSSIIINKIIRNHIKFRGIIISDDISMKALKFNLADNARKALDAGCNLILHCNGNINEMTKLAKVIPRIDIFTQKKTSQFYNFLG